MKNTFPLYLILFFGTYAQAQTSLSGVIHDHSGKPLPYASVALLNVRDSSVAKGTASDGQGFFTFEKVRAGQYLVRATAVGYQKAHSPILDVASEPVAVPTIKLRETTGQLAEVQVTGKKPFVEQRLDRTIINVANSIVASGSTALEVLEKSPGVTVDRQNDQIQFRGREGVIMLIDGRQTYLSMADVVALLRNTPSDNIERIELISNPSARYDAAGNSGLIDIRLKKNNQVGTNGSVSLAAGSGRYDRERGSVQLNHRTPKLNLFGNYSASRGGNYWDFILKRNQADSIDRRNLVDQYSYIRFRERGQNAKVGLDYTLGKNTTVGLVWTGLWSHTDEESPARAFFRRREAGPVYLETLADKTLTNHLASQVVNLNFQHLFGQTRGQLTADVDVGHFTRQFTNTLKTRTLYPTFPPQPVTGLYTHLPVTIDIRTAKIDYSRPLAKGWKLETGLKSSSVFSDNNLTLNQGVVDNLERVDSLSNHFQYTERVNAGYVMVSGKLHRKTEVQAGLRLEHTHSDAHSLNLGDRVKRDYLNVFPSVSVSRPLSERQTLAFSYSYRIDRPNYQSLNPARGYLDPYAFSRGNPYLQPQYTHSLELKHGFRDKVFTSLGANLTDQFMFFIIQPVTGNTTERVPENFGRSQAYNLTVSFPITLAKGWTAQTTLLGTYGQFRFEYFGVNRRVRQVSGRLNASSALTLGRGWSAEATGWLATPAVYAIFRAPWLGTLDVGVQKALGSQWKAKLSVQDVFHTNQVRGWIRTPEFQNNVRIRFDTRVAMLNLTYSFGNQQLKATRQRRTASEDESRRAN